MREAVAPLFDPPRRHPRVRTDLPVRCGDGRATLRDVSCGGAFVASAAPPAVGARITLRFRLLGSMPCEASGRVAWAGGGGFGVDFDQMSRQMKAFAENLTRMPDRLVPLYLAGVLDPALTVD